MYSSARKYEPPASPKSNTGTTFGCTSVDARFASSMNRPDRGGVAVELGAQPLDDERPPELPDPERDRGEHLRHPARADLIDQQVAAERRPRPGTNGDRRGRRTGLAIPTRASPFGAFDVGRRSRRGASSERRRVARSAAPAARARGRGRIDNAPIATASPIAPDQTSRCRDRSPATAALRRRSARPSAHSHSPGAIATAAACVAGSPAARRRPAAPARPAARARRCSHRRARAAASRR